MKNLKLYIPIIALLSLVACKKSFLDTEDVTSATEQNFYKTPDDAWKALVGVYDGLQRAGSSGFGLSVVATEVMSDNAFGGTGNADGFGFQMMDEFDKLRSPSDQDMFGDNWSVYYKAIYRANMLLTHLDQVDWKGNENLRKVYESEARFIRAYLYFDMVRFWGNIPLITAPTTENVPQASPDSVYKLIAEDLKFAAANLPSTSYGAQDPSTRGRVTKWAAESLIGRVFLYYTGYYNKPDLVGVVSKAQALAYLEDVISNGGFGLVDKFANLWPAASLNNYAGEDNKETVFAIKYTYTSDWNGNVDGNHWMVMFGIRVQSYLSVWTWVGVAALLTLNSGMLTMQTIQGEMLPLFLLPMKTLISKTKKTRENIPVITGKNILRWPIPQVKVLQKKWVAPAL